MAISKHTKPLTDASVRNLKPGKKVIEVADHSSPGLRLRVSPFGVRTWFYRFRRPDGGLAKITLGRYPTMSLGAARVEWKRLSDTRDPKAAIEKEKAQQAEEDRKARAETLQAVQDTVTVRDLVQQYTRHISTPGDGFLKSWKEVGRVLERNFVDLYGDLPAHEITRSAIKEVHKRLRAQGKPVAANRALSHIRSLLQLGDR